MLQLAQDFDLSFQFGTAPHDFYLDKAPFPSNDSLLSLFIQEVRTFAILSLLETHEHILQAAPVALTINNTRASIPNVMITNSGSQRFDVLSGSFTKNDQFTASPFTDSFLFIPNVTASMANQVLPALNNQGAEEKRAILQGREHWGRGFVDERYREWLRGMAMAQEERWKRQEANLTLGYVTSDVRQFLFCSSFCSSLFFLLLLIQCTYIGMPRSRGRHPAHSSSLLRHAGFHRLYPAERDGRHAHRPRLRRLHREPAAWYT